MADRGIIFSAPMVRALLAGRKTQTRRLLNPQPAARTTQCSVSVSSVPAKWMGIGPSAAGGTSQWDQWRKLPFSPGDRLYVREHWKTTPAYDDLAPSDMGAEEPLLYLADDATFNWAEADGSVVGRHRQGMHMPRWASRLTLLAREVRVQRLQEVSEEDAEAEGVVWESADPPFWYVPGILPHSLTGVGIEEAGGRHAARSYGKLWNLLHTKPGDRWEDNPWIYALTFEVVRENIDRIAS